MDKVLKGRRSIMTDTGAEEFEYVEYVTANVADKLLRALNAVAEWDRMVILEHPAWKGGAAVPLELSQPLFNILRYVRDMRDDAIQEATTED